MSVLVVVAFFAALELVLAMAGVRPQLYDEDPYVGFSSLAPLFVERRGDDGRVMLETAPNKLVFFNRQSFPRDKGRDTYRVFCVGGSTTNGRPYDDTTSFCGWLRELLAAADPSTHWEVINAGGVSYASYRVAVLMEELARYEPDLFIIYSGHNEFLEQRTYSDIIEMPRALRGLGALAAHTRTHALIKRAVDAVRAQPDAKAPATTLKTEVTTLLDGTVGPSAFTRDDAQRDRILAHYRYNLARMVDIARAAGAGVILVTPASNLRTASPFKSENRNGLSQAQLEQWRQKIGTAQAALAKKDSTAALTALRDALAVDDRHAHLCFLAAQVLEALGQYDEAKTYYERARDEDVCPLRALSPMPGMVREVAADRGAMLVDFEAMVAARAEHGIPGSDLFLDHVHPTIEGNRYLAEALLDAMVARGIVAPCASWGDAAKAKVVARVEGGIDPHAHARALMNLSKVLGWAGKLEEAYVLGRKAVSLDDSDAEVQYQAGVMADHLGHNDEAVAHYLRALEINPEADLPRGNLGVALERQGRLEEAIAQYRLAVKYGTPSSLPLNRDNLANALYKLGATQHRNKQTAAAIASLSESCALRPDHVESNAWLGAAYAAAGRYDDAIDAFEWVLGQRPGNAEIHHRLAAALARSRRWDEAAAHYNRAIELDPRWRDSPHNLLRSLEAEGRTEDAARVRAALAER
jgi:tetratricopeptide (TPR) repeat protein